MTVGSTVEWIDAYGNARRGVVTRIVRGRVYLRCREVNAHGKRVERDVEVWFEPDEIDRLREVTP